MPQSNVTTIDRGPGRETNEQLEARINAMMEEARKAEEAQRKSPISDDDIESMMNSDDGDGEPSRQRFVESNEDDNSEDDEQESTKEKPQQNHNWEKRFKDARRREEALRREVAELRKRKEDETLGLTGDASPEDLAEFVKQHPEFAKVMQVFIKREMKPLYEESEHSRRAAKFESVMAKVAKEIPNYEEIQQSQEIKDWLIEEGKDSIYYQALVAPADRMNARNITRALQAFLEDYPEFGKDSKPKKKGKPDPADVSDVRIKSGKAKPEGSKKGPVFTQSMLENIKRTRGWNAYVDFLGKYEKEIEIARQDSRFYDMPA